MRILFLGQNWWGSCARACVSALRREGHVLYHLDEHQFIPVWKSFQGRFSRRILMPFLVKEYNRHVLKVSEQFKPEVILVFKGTYFRSHTIRKLKRDGHFVVNYFPDPSFEADGEILKDAIPHYSIVVTTKKYQLKILEKHLSQNRIFFVPHGYDADIHNKTELTEQEYGYYGSEVSFAGTATLRKAMLLQAIMMRKRSNFRLRIWGNDWNSLKHPVLASAIVGRAAEGEEYSKVICASKINLAFLRGPTKGCPHPLGDETTTRTYEIPACGGFMLHEQTEEVLSLYKENEEVACFGNTDELMKKIEYYLLHEEEREKIAEAGYRRCQTSKYSYDYRMKEMMGIIKRVIGDTAQDADAVKEIVHTK